MGCYALLAFAEHVRLTAARLLVCERQQVGNDVLDLLRRQDGPVTIALKDTMEILPPYSKLA